MTKVLTHPYEYWRRLVIAALAATLCMTLLPITRASAVPSTSTKTFFARSDAYVSAAQCTKRLGLRTVIKVTTPTTNAHDCEDQTTHQTLLSFDVTGVVGTVTQVDLHMAAVSPNPTAQLISQCGSFKESTVTWNTRPSKGANEGFVFPTASGTAAVNGALSPEWIDGDGRYNMKITAIDYTTSTYLSRESGFTPQLVLTIQQGS